MTNWTSIAAATVLLAATGSAVAAQGSGAPVPDLVGPWNNGNGFRLDPAPSGGPKPIGDLAGYVHHERGVDANGNDFSTNAYIGDYNSSLLTPWASAIMKKEAEEAIKGNDPFWAATACYPFGPTMVLQPEPVIFLQQPDKVTVFYQRDHQVRHVYLNVPHSKNPKPSWYGESIGHYEGGDTLVVDTIGFNDKSFVDSYRTPHTTQLHVTERFKLADGGKTLDVSFTVEDAGAFNAPWSGTRARHRVERGPLDGNDACAEDHNNYFNLDIEQVPMADKPDF